MSAIHGAGGDPARHHLWCRDGLFLTHSTPQARGNAAAVQSTGKSPIASPTLSRVRIVSRREAVTAGSRVVRCATIALRSNAGGCTSSIQPAGVVAGAASLAQSRARADVPTSRPSERTRWHHHEGGSRQDFPAPMPRDSASPTRCPSRSSRRDCHLDPVQERARQPTLTATANTVRGITWSQWMASTRRVDGNARQMTP